MSLLPAIVAVALFAPGPRVGFIEAAPPGLRNGAALAFAQTVGPVTRLRPSAGGGWQAEDRLRAPEECDVAWYHQGEDPNAATLTEAARADLLDYVRGGGSLLLSGCAGALVNSMGIEPTGVRVLPISNAAFESGLVVPAEQRGHPIFAGLDTTRPILLTSRGCDALADFYGTAGPHGTLLAEGTAGLGERPLVEYAVGQGRVILVGWRLADFTTDGDAHRPNLERLFSNMLGYLAARCTNRARLVPPTGEVRYVRVSGVPFLKAAAAQPFATVTGERERCAVALGASASEMPVSVGTPVSVTATGLTLTQQAHPVSSYVAARKAEQDEYDRADARLITGLRVLKPRVTLAKGPLKPLRQVREDRSLLLGRSAFMAPGDGNGDITPEYQPIRDGGFRIVGSRRTFNRMIVQGQNRLLTGDAPLFRIDTGTGNSCYAADRIFPLWPRPDSQAGVAQPCLGTLTLGVRQPGGATVQLADLPGTMTTFRPGYTEYRVTGPASAWHATVRVTPSRTGHGLLCRVAFDRDVPLVWQYGGAWWLESERNDNRVAITDRSARITEANLPNGLVIAGWDGAGHGRTILGPHGQVAEFAASTPHRTYHLAVVWGVTAIDAERARATANRLDTTAARAFPAERDRLKAAWTDCFVTAAVDPEGRFARLMAAPGGALDSACRAWDERRNEFQVRTPDERLDALVNWERCRSEYHRKGPGLYLGEVWQMYSHISTGWSGKEWGGDHQAMADCLRLYGAMQGDDGFIRWVSPSLVPFVAEDNTPYWVDQVWRHYTWTGDRQFVMEMWPMVRKAVAWMRKNNDPDGDGLFRDWYEYWNCDSNGKGPKAATPSAMGWAMLDRAARMAAVVGDRVAERAYRALADRSRRRIMAELWKPGEGRLGSIGSDGIWRGHPQVWEEYLAVNAGLLDTGQARSAMRWLEAHYGFEPKSGVRLLSCSDWWPIRWSVQWVPTGDTCLAALAGMKAGDIDLWWPYIQTVVRSAFKSDGPGINMGISNHGAGGGDREDVDSADPHVHAVVRGLFGIEPAVHEGRMDICPAFPAGWRQASIRTPDISYEYRRIGRRATVCIHTARSLTKRVRACLGAPTVTTRAETDTTVVLTVPAARCAPRSTTRPQVLAERTPPTEADTGKPLTAGEKRRQVLIDLAGARNVTADELASTPFVFDHADTPQPLASWWGNPSLTWQSCPRMLEAPAGVRFLTSGRPRPGVAEAPRNLLALASWKPYSLPAAATVPIGMKCERLWLLLQGYVHPMRNYVVNGEVVLRYSDGKATVRSLVPPWDLDGYFQHFSRRGTSVPMGTLGPAGFIHPAMLSAHADSLEIQCDPTRILASIEIRATCSEAVIGVAAMTVLEAP